MERSSVAKEDDVTSAADESFQFSDDSLRGEEKMCFTYSYRYMCKPLPVSCCSCRNSEWNGNDKNTVNLGGEHKRASIK